MDKAATVMATSTPKDRESAGANTKEEPFAMSIQEGVQTKLLLPQRVNGGPTMPVRLESVHSQNSRPLTKAKSILAIKLRKRETSHERSSASVTD